MAMIVQRLTFQIKGGQRTEVAGLLKAERERTGGTHRIYLSYLGRYDTIAMEFEFEDLAAMETFWSEWFDTSESAAFMEKWNDLLEAPRTNEVWTLVE
jgi:hypothetical protein